MLAATGFGGVVNDDLKIYFRAAVIEPELTVTLTVDEDAVQLSDAASQNSGSSGSPYSLKPGSVSRPTLAQEAENPAGAVRAIEPIEESKGLWSNEFFGENETATDPGEAAAKFVVLIDTDLNVHKGNPKKSSDLSPENSILQ